jgi:lysophospholipase L1-like esterase
MGGWTYALYRLRHDEAGLYHHRAQLFEMMQASPGAIIFLGDSQTEQCEWQELFHSDSPAILNRGIVGDYVEGVLGRLDEIIRHKPKRIFLMVGINDLIFNKTPEEIAGVYREIVARIRSKTPDSELFLQSVLPVNNQVKKIGVENETIQALNVQIAAIARDYALTYIDLYPQLTDADGNLDKKFTEDGIHLNGLGYGVWKREISTQVMSYK